MGLLGDHAEKQCPGRVGTYRLGGRSELPGRAVHPAPQDTRGRTGGDQHRPFLRRTGFAKLRSVLLPRPIRVGNEPLHEALEEGSHRSEVGGRGKNVGIGLLYLIDQRLHPVMQYAFARRVPRPLSALSAIEAKLDGVLS